MIDENKYKSMPLNYRVARFTLLLRKAYPFLGELCMRINKYSISDNNVDFIAATDGLNIKLNESEMMKLPEEGFNFILLHELIHIILNHSFIGDEPYYTRMYHNIAGDLVANSVILDMERDLKRKGLTIQPLSHSHICTDDLSQDSSSVIAKSFVEQAVNQGILSTEPPTEINIKWKSFEETIPNDNSYVFDLLENEIKNNEVAKAEVQEVIKKALEEAGNEGVPNSIKDIIEEFTKGRKLPWFVILRRYLTNSKTSNDYDFIPPDKRYLHNKTILPGKQVDDTTLDNALLVLDVSGSVSKDELLKQLWQIQEILSSLEFAGSIVTFGTKVYEEAVLADKQSLKKFIKDMNIGGGTEWSSIVQYVENLKIKPTVVIVFTDSYFWSFNKGINNAIFIVQEKEYDNRLDKLGKVIVV